MTRQRQILEEAFREAGRPLSASRLWERARTRLPQLGLATVYRFLGDAEKACRVRRLEIPGEAPHFERVGDAHHHHFFCRQCHQVYNLPGCVKGLRILVPKNFQAEDHDILIYGTCGECSLAT